MRKSTVPLKRLSKAVPSKILLATVALIATWTIIQVLPPNFGNFKSLFPTPELWSRGKPTTSSYSCVNGVGGSVGLPYETKDSRSCLYSNLCISRKHGDWVYYADKIDEQYELSKQFTGNASAERDYALPPVDLRGSQNLVIGSVPWTPRFVRGKIPKSVTWSPLRFAAIASPYVATNFGHLLGDTAFPIFRMSQQFRLHSKNVRALILYCRLGQFETMPPMLKQMAQLIWDEEPMFTKEQCGSGALKDVLTRFEGTEKTGTVCFRNVLAGAGEYGFKNFVGHDWEIFIEYIQGRAGFSYTPNVGQTRVAIIDKIGRRKITNCAEIANLIRAHYDDVRVDVISSDAIANMSFYSQIAAVRPYSVVITPPGGVSFITAFQRPGSATIITSFRSPSAQIPSRMEQSLWKFVSDRLVLHYPTDESELVFSYPEQKPPKLPMWEYYRNWVDARLSYSKTIDLVDIALEYVNRSRVRWEDK